MADLPAHYATSFTPTTHAKIPANIDPAKTTLPHPFVVVVTGAGKGLGWHTSLAYAKAGCSGLSISSRTLGDLYDLDKEILTINHKCQVMKTLCDVQSEQSVAQLKKQVKQKWGRCDVVIANAGINIKVH